MLLLPSTFSFLIPFRSIGHKSLPPSNFRPTRNVSHKFGWMYSTVTRAIKTMDNKLATDIVTSSICFTFNLNNPNFHPKDYCDWLTSNKRQQQIRNNKTEKAFMKNRDSIESMFTWVHVQWLGQRAWEDREKKPHINCNTLNAVKVKSHNEKCISIFDWWLFSYVASEIGFARFWFGILVSFWIVLVIANGMALRMRPFDPYQYI